MGTETAYEIGGNVHNVKFLGGIIFIPLFTLAPWVNRNIFLPKIKLEERGKGAERQRDCMMVFIKAMGPLNRNFPIWKKWEGQA